MAKEDKVNDMKNKYKEKPALVNLKGIVSGKSKLEKLEEEVERRVEVIRKEIDLLSMDQDKLKSALEEVPTRFGFLQDKIGEEISDIEIQIENLQERQEKLEKRG